MEAEAENTKYLFLFWTSFNKVLKKVSGNENATFNPAGWCTDMAGANLAGICHVYGDLAKSRIKSCEFILKMIGIKKANKLDTEGAEECKDLYEQPLETVT